MIRTMNGVDPIRNVNMTVSVKGLAKGSGFTDDSVVSVGIHDGGNLSGIIELSPEQANVLGEYLRQAAEEANSQEETA